MVITKKKRKNSLPAEFKSKDLIISVPFDESFSKLNLCNIGDELIPDPGLGKWCKKNACGYLVTDYQSPKIYRYVSTNYIHPWGKKELPRVPVDIHRYCFQKKEIEPNFIKISLVSNNEGEMFYASFLKTGPTDADIITAINVYIEIFGKCDVGTELKLVKPSKIKELEWEILPPDKKPSDMIRQMSEGRKQKESAIQYSEARTKFLEKKQYKLIGRGINGSYGYFGYVYNNICIFECAIYGNATYIVDSSNWEELSKMTKRELIESENVVEKLIHTEKWFGKIEKIFEKYESDQMHRKEHM